MKLNLNTEELKLLELVVGAWLDTCTEENEDYTSVEKIYIKHLNGKGYNREKRY